MTTVVHGSTFSISGSGFGSKSSNTNKFDDASGASLTSIWTYAFPFTATTGNLSYKTPAAHGRGIALPHSHVTKYITGCHEPNGSPDANNGRIVTFGVDFTQAMNSYTRWEYYEFLDPSWVFETPAAVNNHKWYGISVGTGSPYADGTNQWYLEYRGGTDFSAIGGDQQWHTNDDASGGGLENFGNFGYYGQQANSFTDWRKKALKLKWSATSGSGLLFGESDYVNMANDAEYTDAYAGTQRSQAIGGYSGNRDANNWRYFGDVYYDNGPDDGAFYLTNNPVWASRTISEVQPFIKASWTSTNVVLTCNAGRLSNGPVYLFYRSDVNGNQGPLGSFTLADSAGVTATTGVSPRMMLNLP